MALNEAFSLVALKLQEQAATELSHNDLYKWICDAVSGMNCYLIDFFGDSTSGEVIYSKGGDLMRAPYEVRTVNGKVAVAIDDEAAEDVLPRTTYEPEADEDDHYASMEAAMLYAPGTAKFCERFISKAERDVADSGSFAGKGKSYPILKPADVMAAVHAMGRAGPGNASTATIKASIIRIAKAKGWEKYLPKAWQGAEETPKEAAKDKAQCPTCKGTGNCQDCAGAGEIKPKSEAAEITVTGDAILLKEGAVLQDGTAYLKLIAPGRGTSGYYPAEVLERDGPKVFPKGTKSFWDHQTEAEEAARPEGSLRDLASVLSEDAHYEANGPAGPGLYAKAKVFEQFRKPVDDLAKHIGMSIRACGKAKEGKGPDGKVGPIIEQLTKGISVDYVTAPGAGGQILQLFEAARIRPAAETHNEGGATDMEATEWKALQEANKVLAADVRKLRERQAITDAAGVIAQYFDPARGGVQVGEAIQQRVTKRLLERQMPLTDAGDLDATKLKTICEAETKDEVEFISRVSGGRIVVGMGSAATQTTEQIQESDSRRKSELKESADRLGFGKNRKMGRKILMEGRKAFDPNYNSAHLVGSTVSGVAAGQGLEA